MKWDEFCDLLGGLNEQTPLVRVAQIRTETDKEALKQFTPAQRRMRTEWQKKRAKARPQKEVDDYIAMIQGAFASLYG